MHRLGWLGTWAGLLAFAAAIAYLLNNRAYMTRLEEISVGDWILLTAIVAVVNLINSEKMHLLLRRHGLPSLGRVRWTQVFLKSRFLNLHLTQAALIYRSAVLKREYGFSVTGTLGITAIQTWSELCVVLASSLVVLSLASQSSAFDVSGARWAIGTTLGVLIIVPLLLARLRSSSVPADPHEAWWVNRIRDLSRRIGTAARDQKSLLALLVMHLMTTVLQVLWTIFCLSRVGVPITADQAVIYVVAVQLSGAVRILPGNLGITEVVSGVVANALGHSFGVGVVFSLIQRTCVYIFFGTCGIVQLVYTGWSMAAARGRG